MVKTKVFANGQWQLIDLKQPDMNETNSLNLNYVANAPKYYNAAGETTRPTKVWYATVTPDTGNAYSINISSAAFAAITNISILPIKSTAVAAAVPNVAIKSNTTSAVVINITDSDTAAFANSGITLMVRVEGY